MEVLQYILFFLIDLVIGAFFLWVGMKVASYFAGMRHGGQYCSFKDLILVSAGASLVSLVPGVGWLFSWVALFYLLYKVTEAEPRDLIIMVLFSRLAAIFTFALIEML